MKNVIHYFYGFFSSITIEPVIFLTALGCSLISGAEISKKLFMFQICSVELNFTIEDCENLTAVMTTTEKISVQESLNNLLMKSQLISSVPAIVYSVIAGGLFLFLRIIWSNFCDVLHFIKLLFTKIIKFFFNLVVNFFTSSLFSFYIHC